jgi:hypothetical protein
MKIPDDAIIADAKLSDYLLVYKENDYKSKFLAQVGFSSGESEFLEAAIRVLIENEEAVLDRSNEYAHTTRSVVICSDRRIENAQ